MPPARFVTDSSLDFVARRLRFLGYDIATVRGARIEELFEVAQRDGRTVLSLSARHPARFSAVPLITIDRADPAGELRGLVERHEPASPPFSRCPACNVPLHRRHPMEARGEIPARVLRAVRQVRYCPQCGKWYWEGTHVAKLRAWLASALGHPLPQADEDSGS